MKKILISCFAVICLSNLPIAAQDSHVDGFFQNWGIALKVNTFGVGADLLTSLHPNIKMRLGVNYLGFLKPTVNIDFDADNLDGTDQVPVHVDKMSFDFLNGNLFIDLFPLKSLGLHLTAGLYAGKMEIPVYGSAPEPFDVGGYIIRPETDGNVNATLKFGNKYKPYVGLGLGRTIPKSSVGFHFELGAVFQGTPTIISGNMDADSINNRFQEFLKEQHIPKFLTGILPVMSVSVTIRII